MSIAPRALTADWGRVLLIAAAAAEAMPRARPATVVSQASMEAQRRRTLRPRPALAKRSPAARAASAPAMEKAAAMAPAKPWRWATPSSTACDRLQKYFL